MAEKIGEVWDKADIADSSVGVVGLREGALASAALSFGQDPNQE